MIEKPELKKLQTINEALYELKRAVDELIDTVDRIEKQPKRRTQERSDCGCDYDYTGAHAKYCSQWGSR